jgi:hypothetical protein
MSTTSVLVEVERETHGDIAAALDLLHKRGSNEARCAAWVLRKRKRAQRGATRFTVERNGFVRCYAPGDA